jgi:hypothetical protein
MEISAVEKIRLKVGDKYTNCLRLHIKIYKVIVLLLTMLNAYHI